MKVDSTSCISFDTGVEETRKVFQQGTLGESQLHDVLGRLASADQTTVRPPRNTSPLPLLYDVWVGLLD
jgi:hypothetical protein